MKNFTLKYLIVVAQLQLVNSDRNFAHARNLRITYMAYGVNVFYDVNLTPFALYFAKASDYG